MALVDVLSFFAHLFPVVASILMIWLVYRLKNDFQNETHGMLHVQQAKVSEVIAATNSLNTNQNALKSKFLNDMKMYNRSIQFKHNDHERRLLHIESILKDELDKLKYKNEQQEKLAAEDAFSDLEASFQNITD